MITKKKKNVNLLNQDINTMVVNLLIGNPLVCMTILQRVKPFAPVKGLLRMETQKNNKIIEKRKCTV